MSGFSDLRGVTAADGTTKARIERAAITLFAEQGVDAVTTREIAAAAGVSEGALYRHYKSKAELAGTAFFAIHQRLAGAVRAAAEAHGSIEGQARAVVAAYCDAADEDWTLFSYHLLNTHRFLPTLPRGGKRETESPVAAVEQIIADAMARGETPKGDPDLKAAMALGVVLQTALHKFYGRIPGEMSAHRPALEAAVIAVLAS